MSKPWDPCAELPAIGDASEEVLFAAVGRALSKWESIESELATLFLAFNGLSGGSLVARRAYATLNGLQGRYQMAKEAASAYFDLNHDMARVPNLQKYCNHAITLYRKFSKIRNQIAHGMVQEYKIKDKNTYVLAPAIYQVKDAGSSSTWRYAYTSETIDRYSSSFSSMSPYFHWCCMTIASVECFRLTGKHLPIPPEPPAP